MIKEKQILVTKYETEDGRLFDTLKAAEHHEKLQTGQRKKCPMCDGSGEVDAYGDGRVFSRCQKCGGKGWLELKGMWV